MASKWCSKSWRKRSTSMVLRTPLSVCLKLKARFEHELFMDFGLLISKKLLKRSSLTMAPSFMVIYSSRILIIHIKVNLCKQSLKCSSLNFEVWPPAVVQIHATLAHTMQIKSGRQANKQTNKQTGDSQVCFESGDITSTKTLLTWLNSMPLFDFSMYLYINYIYYSLHLPFEWPIICM